MDSVYLLLLALAGLSFFLHIDWLMLSSIFLFFAVLFAKYYSDVSTPSQPPPTEVQQSEPPSQQPQPIIVVQGGGTAATITDSMISTMMGNLMAMDVYEKADTQPFWGFLQRGRRMRQGFFDHAGKYGSKHKIMQREVTGEAFSEITKRLDKIASKLERN